MTTYSIYSGADHRDTVGKVAPALFAQEGRCWRMVYETQSVMERTAWSLLSGSGGGSS